MTCSKKKSPGPTQVFGYPLDPTTHLPLREFVTPTHGQDYGADPLGNGKFRMIPSGDEVDYEERCRRLRAASNYRRTP
jgi:hypothetical protein